MYLLLPENGRRIRGEEEVLEEKSNPAAPPTANHVRLNSDPLGRREDSGTMLRGLWIV